MKAFWWYKENELAGMARPGFNHFRWLDLPFDEAILLSWMGQQAKGSGALDSFRDHLRSYGTKIRNFHKISDTDFESEISKMTQKDYLLNVLERVKNNTQTISDYEIVWGALDFSLNTDRLKWEVDQLKEKKIRSIIALNEHHHNRDDLSKHFNVYHFSIEDLGPPTLEQAQELAQIISIERDHQRPLAIHCLAGIGRTSTMIMAAHVLLGEDPQEIEQLLKKKNTAFTLSPPQKEFIKIVLESKNKLKV